MYLDLDSLSHVHFQVYDCGEGNYHRVPRHWRAGIFRQVDSHSDHKYPHGWLGCSALRGVRIVGKIA